MYKAMETFNPSLFAAHVLNSVLSHLGKRLDWVFEAGGFLYSGCMALEDF
jgi:hypothetical protein